MNITRNYEITYKISDTEVKKSRPTPARSVLEAVEKLGISDQQVIGYAARAANKAG